MVHLAQLLVVMFDQLKIARIYARNVPRVHGHKRNIDDDASLASFTPGKRRCRVLDALARRPVETQKNWTTYLCLTVASERESCHVSMPSSIWHHI